MKEYRFLLVLRGERLSGAVEDTDPQEIGRQPLDPRPSDDTPETRRTAEIVARFVEQASDLLREEHPANMMLVRGFSRRPHWPRIDALYGVRAAAIAAYPMYRGVAKLSGMDMLDSGSELRDECETLEQRWAEYDCFYVHAKRIDSAGEDGHTQAKIAHIEEVDASLPRRRALDPDVIVVTGGQPTPAPLRDHSWHPVPLLLWSPHCRACGVRRFGEGACMSGDSGPRMPAAEIMPLALANAIRLEKFGA